VGLGDRAHAALSRAPRRIIYPDLFAVGGLLLVGVGLPLLVGWVSGALTVPHNDDFNYRRVALGLYETGRVELTGWTVMSLVGQVLFVQPFLWIAGGHPAAFAVATGTLAVAGLAASYFLARRILSRAAAVLAVLLVIAFPGFLLNTTSFMTDVPAFAGIAICLALGAVGLEPGRRRRWRWLAASLAAGCFAFSIREFALAAPVAVLVLAALARRGEFPTVVVAGAAVLGTCAAIHVVTSQLPGQGTADFAALSTNNLERTRLGITTLAFGLAPAILIAAAGQLRAGHAAGAAVGAMAGGALFGGELLALARFEGVPTVLVGNLLDPAGAPGSGALAGERPLLFPPPTWDVMNVVALGAVVVASGTLGALLAGRRRQSPRTSGAVVAVEMPVSLLVVFTVLYGSGMLAFGLVASMFDRYLWPLALSLSILLLAAAGRPRRSAGLLPGLAAFVVVAGSALALMLNSAAFDAARWRMGELAISRGIPRESVDAGMEWVGYHATGVATADATPTSGEMWYDARWPSFRLCGLVSSSLLDLPTFRLEAADVSAYRLLLVAGPEAPLYLYRVSNSGCP
jgi:dolichyl-phosphate-mannose-protein mannosyltransferase